MREILFRGKRIDAREWVEGFYLTSPEFDNNGLAVITTDNPRQAHYVHKETVGQFTGLTDKNGKKIFEGDIILFEDESPTNYEYHDCTEMRCGEIKFDDGQFYLTSRVAVEMGDLIYDGELDGEVIGNIHDNPKLLERSENGT